MYDDNVPHYPTKYRAILVQRLEYLESCIAKSKEPDVRAGFQERECQAIRHVLGGGSVDPQHAARLSLTSCVRRVRRLLLDVQAADLPKVRTAVNAGLRELENALLSLSCEPHIPETFAEAWAQMEALGYCYGDDALENVSFGWDIAMGVQPRETIERRAGEAKKVSEQTDERSSLEIASLRGE